MKTLAGWGERRIIAAMRAWRDGCGPLRPWFRATPFAAAHHYRERDLPVDAPGRVPAAVARFAATLAGPDPATLRIFDVPAATGLWLAYALRRRCGISAALCWNGWWDPKGVLDGRHEIVLLLTLGDRLRRSRAGRSACLVFDADRQREPASAEHRDALDNRYCLGEEDAPAIDQIRAAGWRRVHAFTWGAPAQDLVPYLTYLERDMPVTVDRDVVRALHGDG